MLEVHSKVQKSSANYVGPELNVIELSDFTLTCLTWFSYFERDKANSLYVVWNCIFGHIM